MSFIEPKDFCIGNRYRLTEFVEGIKVSTGDYFFVSTEKALRERYGVAIGFAKTENGGAKVFLVEAHAQFGGLTWRRAFKHISDGWEIYWPAGGRTWNHSYVIVDRVN